MAEPNIRPTDLVIILVILAVAALLRVVALDAPLWYDEILTLTRYVGLPLGELVSEYSSFNNHLFYSLQAKASVWLLGESNWALRLPALLLGVASIGAMWRLAYRVSGALPAHVTALLLAVSYHHVWFSQNARGYTGLTLWLTAATIVLIQGLRAPTLRTWCVYGGLIAAAMYTHLTAAPFVLAHAIIAGAMVAAPQRWGAHGPETGGRRPLLHWWMPGVGFLVGGLLTVTLYAPSLGQVLERVVAMPDTSAVDLMVEYQSPIWTLMEIIRSIAQPDALTAIVALVATALIGVGVRDTARREPIVAAVLLLHIPLTLIILLAGSARIWPRYFFADIGFLLFFMTQGVWVCCHLVLRLPVKLPVWVTGRTMFVVAALAMVLVSLPLLVRNYRLPKQNLAGAAAYVESERTAMNAVVMVGVASEPYATYFETDWRQIHTLDDLRGVRSAADVTWLVMAFPSRTTRDFPAIMGHVSQHFSLAREFRGTLGDGSVLVYVDNGTMEASLE